MALVLTFLVVELLSANDLNQSTIHPVSKEVESAIFYS